MFSEYIILLYYFFFSFFIVLVLLFFSFLVVKKDFNSEKLSAYECGFNPYEDTRLKFEIRYFLIGLLFIVFDLEIAFLLPYIV
jgi:NADH-quinone oxidoreductase subunit A